MKLTEILKRIIYGKGVTPLPFGITLIAFLFIEFNISEVNAAKSVGTISSAMFVGRIVSSIMWGYVCDKVGKRMSLILATSSLAIATLIFGFSFNFTWAVIARTLQGLTMGLIVITKAVISDVADNSNLAAGLSFIFSASNIGFIVGPSISGYLVFPVEKYPSVFNKGSFFDTFKVFIPNLIIALGLLISLIIALYLLPKGKKSNSLNEQEINLTSVSKPCLENAEKVIGLKSCDEDVLISKKSDSSVSFYQKFRNSEVGILLYNKDFLISIMLYFLYSIFTVGFEELFPVYAATSIEYNGLGLSSSNIGLFYLVAGIVSILIQFLFINKLINRYGAKKMFCCSTFLFAVFVLFFPTNGLIKNRKLLWVSLWITQCLTRSMFSAGVLCVNMFLNNSVDSQQRGLANGIGLSLASAGRSIGAVGFGSAYSWSMGKMKANKGLGFPLNHYFAFILISTLALLFLVIVTRVPNRLNKKKCG